MLTLFYYFNHVVVFLPHACCGRRAVFVYVRRFNDQVMFSLSPVLFCTSIERRQSMILQTILCTRDTHWTNNKLRISYLKKHHSSFTQKDHFIYNKCFIQDLQNLTRSSICTNIKPDRNFLLWRRPSVLKYIMCIQKLDICWIYPG